MRGRALCSLLLLGLLATSLSAYAEQRIALVIGNAGYEGGTWVPLSNAARDAIAMTDTLRQLGFKIIGDKPLVNASLASMDRAVTEFGRELVRNPGAIAFFYYSGHGTQARVRADGLDENYLIPIGSSLQDDFEASIKAMALDRIIKTIDAAAVDAGVIVLDACRNNGLQRNFKSGPSASKGLASLYAGGGMLIAYATAPSQVALDGNGQLSPYTARLVEGLKLPGKALTSVLYDVRAAVERDTNGQQRPQFVASLNKEIFLAGGSTQVITDGRGELLISSRPVGARIYVEGVFRGQAPLTVMDIPAGRVVLVRGELAGYGPYEERVQVARDQSLKLDLSLRENPAPDPKRVESAKPKVSKAVGEPLKRAQEAMRLKQFDAALVEIYKAQAVINRTDFEDYQIDEFLGYVLIQQKRYADAAIVYERMVNSGQMPAEQVDDRVKAVSQMNFQVKAYAKAIDWAKRWLDKHPGNEDMTVLLAQSYYLVDDYRNAAETMSQVVSNAEQARQIPKENYLQILLSSQFKIKNDDGIAVALKKMVRYYPKPEYWDNLIDVVRRKSAGGDRLTLGFYRLMNDVGVLKDKGDFMELAQLGIEAGVPGESERVVMKGIESGILKSDDRTEQARYDRLLAATRKQAAADRSALAQLARDAEKTREGQADVGLGQAYLSYGNYAQAIAVLERGIQKGAINDADEAQISLGVAYLKNGQSELARQALRSVKSNSKWSGLADLWIVRTQSPSMF